MPESKSPSSEPQPAPSNQDGLADARGRPQREGEVGRQASELDPTRYGDWEKNGRCIDF
jgi:hypothetical protein